MNFPEMNLSLYSEQIVGKGEDAQPVGVLEPEGGLLVVSDGMGGAGSTLYTLETGERVTGARIGAQLAANCTKKTFLKLDIGNFEHFRTELSQQLKTDFTEKIQAIQPVSSLLKSKLLKRLPTTLAGIYYQFTENERVSFHSFWAGDSRTYLALNTGMQQLSTDDLQVQLDAYDNLTGDSAVNRCIHVDSSFELSSCSFENQPLPLMLIAATDGCFASHPAPFFFEYILLETLCVASTWDEWKAMLFSELKRLASDDFSLSLAALGFRTFEELSAHYEPRWLELYSTYIEPIEKKGRSPQSQSLKKELWLKYKTHYENG